MSNSEANVRIFRAAVVKNKFSALTQPKLSLCYKMKKELEGSRSQQRQSPPVLMCLSHSGPSAWKQLTGLLSVEPPSGYF